MAIRKVIPRSLDSAAASANLSFDANTLFVDSTNNAVGINTATPNTFAAGGLAVYATSNPSVSIVSGGTSAFLRLYTTSDVDMYLSNVAGKMTFTTAATARMTIDSAGNVGIGTSSPQSLLDLTGNDPTLRFTDNAGSPTASFSIRSTDGTLRFRDITNSSDRVTIDSSGNVGIGTSSPAVKLQVSGAFAVSANANGVLPSTTPSGLVISQNYAAGAAEIDFFFNDSTFVGDNGGFRFYQKTGASTAQEMLRLTQNTVIAYTGGTERMRITSEGKVGIGNSSPAAQNLHVGSGAGGSTAINGYTRLAVEASDYAVVTVKCPAANFSQIIFADSATTNLGGINYFGSTNGTPNAMAFLTGGGNERMRISSAGEVGIFTTIPSQLLTLGNATGGLGIGFGDINSNYANIFTSYGSGAIIIAGGLQGGRSSDTYTSSYGNSSMYRSAIRVDSFNGTGIQFFTDSSTTVARGTAIVPTERMRIDTSGRLLIGTTTATASASKLELVSPANTALSIYMFKSTQVEVAMGFKSSTDSNFYIGTGSSAVGTNGVYLTNTGTSWTSNSDERLKENLVPIENAISKVCALRSVIGNFISDQNKTPRPFLIAQDVQAVLPEAVSTTETDGIEYLGVSYTDVIPLLVASIKEQQALIAQLQADVAALQAK